MVKTLLRAMFRDLGFSKKSAELRIHALELMAEADRRGIDVFAEMAKAFPSVTLPPFPTFNFTIPTCTFTIPLD